MPGPQVKTDSLSAKIDSSKLLLPNFEAAKQANQPKPKQSSMGKSVDNALTQILWTPAGVGNYWQKAQEASAAQNSTSKIYFGAPRTDTFLKFESTTNYALCALAVGASVARAYRNEKRIREKDPNYVPSEGVVDWKLLASGSVAAFGVGGVTHFLSYKYITDTLSPGSDYLDGKKTSQYIAKKLLGAGKSYSISAANFTSYGASFGAGSLAYLAFQAATKKGDLDSTDYINAANVGLINSTFSFASMAVAANQQVEYKKNLGFSVEGNFFKAFVGGEAEKGGLKGMLERNNPHTLAQNLDDKIHLGSGHGFQYDIASWIAGKHEVPTELNKTATEKLFQGGVFKNKAYQSGISEIQAILADDAEKYMINGVDKRAINPRILEMVPSTQRAKFYQAYVAGEVGHAYDDVAKYISKTFGKEFNPVRMITNHERTLNFALKEIGGSRNIVYLTTGVAMLKSALGTYNTYKSKGELSKSDVASIGLSSANIIGTGFLFSAWSNQGMKDIALSAGGPLVAGPDGKLFKTKVLHDIDVKVDGVTKFKMGDPIKPNFDLVIHAPGTAFHNLTPKEANLRTIYAGKPYIFNALNVIDYGKKLITGKSPEAFLMANGKNLEMTAGQKAWDALSGTFRNGFGEKAMGIAMRKFSDSFRSSNAFRNSIGVTIAGFGFAILTDQLLGKAKNKIEGK